MYREGKPVNFVTAMAEMKNKGLYESLGGQLLLVQLTANISSSIQLPYYAEIVKDIDDWLMPDVPSLTCKRTGERHEENH